MKNFRKLAISLTVLLISLVLIPPVFASDGYTPLLDDQVIMFGTFTLESGETLDGSLVVFGGVVDVQADATILGDMIVFGGNVTSGGEVHGSMVAFGGVVNLTEDAVIRGDLIAPATVVRRDEGARISGQIITSTDNIQVDIPDIPEMPNVEIPEVTVEQPTFWDNLSRMLQPVVSFFGSMARALIFSAVAAVILLLLPEHGRRVGLAVQEYPVASGGFGLLSVFVFVASVVMLALLSITIILIPLTIPLIILLSIALTIGMFFGIIVVGAEVGRRMMEGFNQNWSSPVQVAIGTFSLTFVLGLLSISLWGFIGGLLWSLVGAVGLGAVLLTRFGTRTYVSTKSTQPETTSASLPVEVEDMELDIEENVDNIAEAEEDEELEISEAEDTTDTSDADEEAE